MIAVFTDESCSDALVVVKVGIVVTAAGWCASGICFPVMAVLYFIPIQLVPQGKKHDFGSDPRTF